MSEKKNLSPFEFRNNRIQAAVHLEEPDQVPFVPSIGNMFCLEYPEYGATVKDVMTDITKVIPAMDKLCEELDPDLLFAPTFFPIPTMKRLDAQYYSWPGKTPEYGDNFCYQMGDGCFLEEDEYDDFLKDPGLFLIQKVLPKKYPALAGLAMLNPYSLCSTTVMGFSAVGAPPMQESLKALSEAGQLTAAYAGGMGQMCMHAIQNGYPLYGQAVAMNPFDDFADCIRGLVNTVMDLASDPELLEQAVNRYAEITIPASVGMAKMMHADYVFIPLHAGMDEFMSPDDYNDYYWPPLKKLLLAIIGAGMTPVCMCEGNYFSRLNTLTDVPAGKVIYLFEKTNIEDAVKILKPHACIGGFMPTDLLMHGNPEQIVEETRRELDLCMPGGGYVASNSMSLDAVPRENCIAWAKAVRKYGKY